MTIVARTAAEPIALTEDTPSAVAQTIDPGCLPAWGQAELPAPPPFTPRNALRMVGPGVIAMATAVGAGEWLFGPVATVKYQGQLLSLGLLVIVFQTILNTECIRYTLYTGEPVFAGFMRLKPGPRVLGPMFMGSDLLTSFLPGFAMTSATALAALTLGQGVLPGPEHRDLVEGFATVVLISCTSLFLFGGKVYNSIQAAQTMMVVLIFGFLLYVAVALIDGATWITVGRGFTGFSVVGELATSGELLVAGAFIGYTGLGGLGNATVSNYVRDKGWGMGSTVGAIPSVIGGKSIQLSHLGKVFPITPANLESWRGWWRYVAIDQYGIFGLGCLIGLAIPAAIGLQFVQPGQEVSHWGAAAVQAQGMARAAGPVFWYLTIACGFLILLTTQLGGLESLPRRWTDLAWIGSQSARGMKEGWVNRIYYGVALVYVGWCLFIITVGFQTPFYLVVIMANMELLPIMVTCVLTVIVNRRFLPKPLRPPLWREAVLIAAAIFYGTLFIATSTLDEKGLIRLIASAL